MLNSFKSIISPFNHIIYDFDGTIVHLEVNWGVIKLALKDVFGISFHPLWKTIDELELKEQKQALDLISRYELEAIKENHYTVNELGMSTLKLCIQKDKPLSIFSTNSLFGITEVLNNLNIFQFFSIIIGCESVSKHKPDPEGIKKIIYEFSLNPSEILFIGDTEKDAIASKISKVNFLMIHKLASNSSHVNKILTE